MIRRRCVSVLAVLLLLFGGLIVLPHGAKADNPIEKYTITFSSMGDLEHFFQSYDFYIAKYDKGSGEWKEDASIPKDTVYQQGKYYVIAPYFYDDGNGYPNLIPDKGVMITLQNLDNPNATVVITGFQDATITVSNVRSHIIIGRSVKYAGNGVNKDSPPWWSYNVIGGLIYMGTNTANYLTIRSGVWSGATNSYINIRGASHVEIDNYAITQDTQSPVIASNVENLTFKNMQILPPSNVMDGGSAVMLTNVGNVSFYGSNVVRGYATAFSMKNVGVVNNRGYVIINGLYYDGKEYKKGGTGIYANKVKDFKSQQAEVDATGEFFTGIKATAYYNQTNETIWGNMTSLVFMFYNGENNGHLNTSKVPLSFVYGKKLGFVGKVKENITNSTGNANGSFDITNTISVKVHIKNDTTGEDISGWFALSQAKVVWIEKSHVVNGTNGSVRAIEFYGETITNNGAYFKGKLPFGFMFKDLDSGVSVPDDGSQERDFIDSINATATFINVNHRILLFASQNNEIYEVNYGLAFGGLSAIMSLFVTVGWMRVGFMVMSSDAQKRKMGKDMIMKAGIGTLIVAFVLFGWANALGLFNWIMGG